MKTMIEIDTTTAFMLYLAIFLGICALAWIKTFVIARKTKATIEIETLTTCEYCHHSFLGMSNKTLSRCPECNCLIQTSPSKSV